MQDLGTVIIQANQKLKNFVWIVSVYLIFDFIFLSQCYSLTTHESGDGRTAGGVIVKARVTIIDN